MRVRELIIELRHLDVEDEEFEAKFSELLHDVQHHVEAEENEMFPEAEQIMADQLEDLMDEMVVLKEQLKTA